MPKTDSAIRAVPPSLRLARRLAAPAWALCIALGASAPAWAQDESPPPAPPEASASEPAPADIPLVPLALGDDDRPDEFAYQTYDAIQHTLDFQYAVLPPLKLPRLGAPELRDVAPDPKTLPIAPITVRASDAVSVVRTVHVSLAESPTTLASLDDRQSLQWRIDGLPSPAEAPQHVVAPVRPTAVNPQGFSLGASWGAEDRIRAPVLDNIAWQAEADVAAGAAPDRGTTVVRRSLRLTAGWDRPEDLALNVSQGVQVGGGTAYQRYATGVRASLFDAPQATRFSGFVELSGEHLALTNLAENTSAVVNAGGTWRAARNAQVDFSLSRGLAPTAEMQSNVGVSMQF